VETQNLFTHKSMSLVHDYKVAAHFNSVTKASEMIFDGKPEKWQTFENHLIREVKKMTIGWSKDILSFKIMGQDPPINFLERYFDIPENMIEKHDQSTNRRSQKHES
jgi:hypothetical protein